MVRFCSDAYARDVRTETPAASSIVARAPRRAKSTPTSGLEKPITMANSAALAEICVMLQPNSACRGPMKTGKT